MPRKVRWGELLCAECVGDLLASPWDRLPRWRRLMQGKLDCSRCLARVDRIANPGEGVDTLPVFHHLPAGTRRAMVAAHEAGHVVSGLAFDYPMTRAFVGPGHGVGSDGPGGRVDYDFGRDPQIRHDEYAASVVAGSFAQQRWLRERDFELSDADWVDIHYSAVGDMMTLERNFGRSSLPRGAWEIATEIVSSAWTQIQHVSSGLLHYGRMNAQDVRRVMHSGGPPVEQRHRQRRDLASNTTTTGGTVMGIEELRGVIASVEDRNRGLMGQLSQIKNEIDSIVGTLQEYVGQSSDTEVHSTIGQQQGIGERLDQLSGELAQVNNGLLSYGQRL